MPRISKKDQAQIELFCTGCKLSKCDEQLLGCKYRLNTVPNYAQKRKKRLDERQSSRKVRSRINAEIKLLKDQIRRSKRHDYFKEYDIQYRGESMKTRLATLRSDLTADGWDLRVSIETVNEGPSVFRSTGHRLYKNQLMIIDRCVRSSELKFESFICYAREEKLDLAKSRMQAHIAWYHSRLSAALGNAARGTIDGWSWSTHDVDALRKEAQEQIDKEGLKL